MSSKRTVLITGCSDGGIGAALAKEFHNAGLHVYATARNPSKMKTLEALGIETLPLDVLSDESIAECVKKVPSLDILINNAGVAGSAPFADLQISHAKRVFDVNVWSYLAVTQAFLPHLLKSKGMIVNHTSVGVYMPVPFQSAYNASKAAMAMFSDVQRLELEPFGIRVIDLKTGGVETNISQNQAESSNPTLPPGSIYEPAKETIEYVMKGEWINKDHTEPVDVYAKNVVSDLLKKNPSSLIWRGKNASMVRLSSVLPHGMFDSQIKKLFKMDEVEAILKK